MVGFKVEVQHSNVFLHGNDPRSTESFDDKFTCFFYIKMIREMEEVLMLNFTYFLHENDLRNTGSFDVKIHIFYT